MGLLENWPIKVAFLLAILFVAAGIYYVYQAGQHLALQKQMVPILTEKYKAPTEKAWRGAYEELGIDPETYPERKLTTEELRRYVEMYEQAEAARKSGKAPPGSP